MTVAMFQRLTCTQHQFVVPSLLIRVVEYHPSDLSYVRQHYVFLPTHPANVVNRGIVELQAGVDVWSYLG
jgi:hypothetical protein